MAADSAGNGSVLPSALDVTCNSRFVKISKDQLTATYTGMGNHSQDVGSVRVDKALPQTLAMWYFEVTVLDNEDSMSDVGGPREIGTHCGVTIGLAPESFPLNTQVGFSAHSYGWRAVDGKIFGAPADGDPDNGTHSSTSARGRDYGSSWTSGDTVGCGYDFSRQAIFYTKNGILMGTAFQGVPCVITAGSDYPVVPVSTPRSPLFGTVSMHIQGERVRVNLGHTQKFLFDLTAYQNALSSARLELMASENNPHQIPRMSIRKVVTQYLLHQGCSQTLAALNKDTSLHARTQGDVEPGDEEERNQPPPTTPSTLSNGPPQWVPVARRGEVGEGGSMPASNTAAPDNQSSHPSDSDSATCTRSKNSRRQQLKIACVPNDCLNETILDRARLRELIISGNPEGALKLLEKKYPQVLADKPVISLALTSQALINLVIEKKPLEAIQLGQQRFGRYLQVGGDEKKMKHHQTDKQSSSWLTHLFAQTSLNSHNTVDAPCRMTSSKRRRRGTSGSGLSCDEPAKSFPRRSRLPWLEQRQHHHHHHRGTIDGTAPFQNGRDTGSSVEHDWTTFITEVMGLLAYEDPTKSPLSFLLSREHVEGVASLVNGAVVACSALTLPHPLTVLETLLHQLIVTKQLTRELTDNHGELFQLPEVK